MSRRSEIALLLRPFGFTVEEKNTDAFTISKAEDKNIEIATGYIASTGISVFYQPRERLEVGWKFLGGYRHAKIPWQEGWGNQLLKAIQKELTDDEILGI